MLRRVVIVTCEHGGNRIPHRFHALFAAHGELLRSHEGYDAGALRLAREICATLGAEGKFSVVSRLLIDLNRSLGHPENMSAMTRSLDAATQAQIIDQYYTPYRDGVTDAIRRATATGAQVLHLSCHSFAPELDGEQRDAHIGLLFDPVRVEEARLCKAWQMLLEQGRPALLVRENYPYLGVDDGLATSLRAQFPDPLYAGIELEVRQDCVRDADLRRLLCESLKQVLTASTAVMD